MFGKVSATTVDLVKGDPPPPWFHLIYNPLDQFVYIIPYIHLSLSRSILLCCYVVVVHLSMGWLLSTLCVMVTTTFVCGGYYHLCGIGLLTKDPNKRMTMDQAYQHPFIQMAFTASLSGTSALPTPLPTPPSISSPHPPSSSTTTPRSTNTADNSITSRTPLHVTSLPLSIDTGGQ